MKKRSKNKIRKICESIVIISVVLAFMTPESAMTAFTVEERDDGILDDQLLLGDSDDNGFEDQYEQELTEMFCPWLILHSGDQEVSPEPVEIIKQKIWVSGYDFAQPWYYLGEDETFWGGDISMIDSWYYYNHYSHYGDTTCFPGQYAHYKPLPHFDYAGPGPGPHCGERLSGEYYDQPNGWYDAYAHGNEWVNPGTSYENTVYAHLFTHNSEYIIQYWFFYPFNDFVNNHEGDWEHINVVITSQDPSVARIDRVVYYFHHYYYISYTTQEENPQVFDCYVVDNTHPVVFIGGYGENDALGSHGEGHGSHGSYPVFGMWPEVSPDQAWGIIPATDEYVDGQGLSISYYEFVDGDIDDEDGIIIIKGREDYDFSQNPEMSWLGANILWGYPYVHSFCTRLWDYPPGVSDTNIGNRAPCGPAYNDAWEKVDWDIGEANGYEGYARYWALPDGYSHVSDAGWSPPPKQVINCDTGEEFWKIQFAIDDADTDNGDTILVRNDTHYENIIINKSINLVGGDRNMTSIDGSGLGDVITITADLVNISGFVIKNSGSYSGDAGIDVSANHITISKNTILDNYEGIWFTSSCNNNTILQNTIISTLDSEDSGICFSSVSRDNLIFENNISGYWKGINVWSSCHNITILGNNISNNDYGVNIHSLNNSNIIDNTISENCGAIRLGESSHSNNISGNAISHNDWGISLGYYFGSYCFYNTISDNTISSNNGNGIYLSYTGWTNITRNTIIGNAGPAIKLDRENYYTLILRNVISNNNRGITLSDDSNNNWIFENTITNSIGYGILIQNSFDIKIRKNTILNNSYGLYLTGNADSNDIFHNNFISNRNDNAYDNCDNYWSCLDEGNYWDDFDDQSEGAYDNDSDGIVDTPYNIPGGNNNDYAPLIEPWKFLSIEGYCHYYDMTTAENVTIEVINTWGKQWQAETSGNYYSLQIAPGILEDVEAGQILRIIARDNKSNVNVTNHEVTRDNISTGAIQLNLTLDVHYRDLKDFPMYDAKYRPPYDIYQMTGAAVAQMILNYLHWNSSRYPEEPPETFENQTWLFENFNQNDDYINSTEMADGLNEYDPGPGYGYNFYIYDYESDQINTLLKAICFWIDYRVGDISAYQEGYPEHVPVAVPTYSNYYNWMVIRGIHTNIDAWEKRDQVIPAWGGNPENLTVYGFWLNDPYPMGIGANSYKTVSEFLNIYFSPIDDPYDTYHNKYVAIVEPPEDFNHEIFGDDNITIGAPPERFNQTEAQLIEDVHDMGSAAPKPLQRKADMLIFNASLDAIRDIAVYDTTLAHMIDKIEPVKTVYVSRVGGSKYYIAVFGNPTTVVRIDANTGRLLEFSISEEQTAYEYLADLGIQNVNGAAFARYTEGSPFYPDIICSQNNIGI